jgi:hypothetical protein
MVGNTPTVRALIKVEDREAADVRALQFSVNSKALTVGCGNSSMRIYDVTAKPRVLSVYKSKIDNGYPLVYSNDGKTLAIGGDKNIELWAGKPLAMLVGHTERVRGLSYSPDGRYLASAADDGRIMAWDLATRKSLELKQKPGRFTAVAFAPTPDVKPADVKEMLLAMPRCRLILLMKLGLVKSQAAAGKPKPAACVIGNAFAFSPLALVRRWVPVWLPCAPLRRASVGRIDARTPVKQSLASTIGSRGRPPVNRPICQCPFFRPMAKS